MAKQRFKISRFLNPSGDEVFRLSGTLNGKRIRKNFKTRDEAVAERQVLEVEHLNGKSEGQTVWTTLTHEQNRDAIAAVNRLQRAGSGKSLSFAVDYLLQHYREAAEEKAVSEAATEYVEVKTIELDREIISKRQFRSIKAEMVHFCKSFGKRTVSDVQPDEIKTYLDKPQGNTQKVNSLKTWNNRRGYLSTFFKYCLEKEYAAQNPILRVPQFKIKKGRGTAETMSATEVAEFMHWLEGYQGQQSPKRGLWWSEPGCMVPYFALTFFAGVRPDWKDGEIKKLRPEDIRLNTGVISIEPEVSKTNEKRSIKIQPNLRLWLEKYPLDRFPILAKKRFKEMITDIRKQFDLGHDVMRHTFCSMTVGAFRSVGDAALQAGNSETVIRQSYLDVKSVEEADQFWQITPVEICFPEIVEKREGRYVVDPKERM
jgi:integrase